MTPLWRVDMLGTFRAEMDSVSIGRFRTRRVGLLLAYLAFYPKRMHHRDEIAEMLWPDQDPEVSRRNLRQALSSLRHHLEPPGLPTGSILIVKQSSVQLSTSLVATDVAEFEQLLAKSSVENSESIRRENLEKAIELYKGELLPGFYEDWVQTERLRLADSHFYALRTLAELNGKAGREEEAIRFLSLAVAKEPLEEDLHLDLMRHYLKTGRPSSALKQFRELERTLRTQLGVKPNEMARKLAEKAKQEGGTEAGEEDGAPTGRETKTSEPPKEKAGRKSSPAASRLPVQLTRFFGRTSDIERSLSYFGERNCRLVSILGPAGTGKTRFSIEIGERLHESRNWNVWFVPLADLADGSMVLDAILNAIRPRNDRNGETIEQIQAALTGPNNLLILDNLEHIIESTLPVIRTLLQDIPNLACLVTSRHSLKLDGEQEVHLEPLPLPDPGDRRGEWTRAVSAEFLRELADCPSVQLFVDRCQAIRPDFQLTINNGRSVSMICKKLEGLPLAIEIAAGLSTAFTPSQILQNLHSRLEILKSRRRDVPARHQSLRAAIDYSFDGLTPDLQAFFSRLSVFRGGFTVEAASQIALPKGISGRRRTIELGLRMILDLQERSLVNSAESAEGAPARFRLFEIFREYGFEQLSDTEEEALRNVHARFYLDLINEGRKLLPEQQMILRALEHDNCVAALQLYFEHGQLGECVQILMPLNVFRVLGPQQIERSYVEKIAESPNFKDLQPSFKVNLLRLRANVYLTASDYDACYANCQRALEIAKESGDDELLAIAYGALAVAAGYCGHRQESIDLNTTGLSFAKKSGNFSLHERACIGLGTEYWAIGKLDAARLVFMDGIEASKRSNGGEASWLMLYNLARVLLDQGALDEAMPIASEALRKSKQIRDDFGTSMSLSMISRYHWLKGSIEAALATSNEALVRRQEVGFVYWLLNAIQFHGLLLAAGGHIEGAVTLLGATHGTLKMERVVDIREYESAIVNLKSKLPKDQFERAWATGLGMDMEEAFDLAIQYK
jgi:predicted ATPase/DNA-binding SARP family transcriptional activator